MKKLFAVLSFVLVLSLGMSAMAADMGIQVIGGPAISTEPVSLDDLKISEEAEIDGWGILTLTAFEIQDGLGYYRSGKSYVDSSSDYYWSGQEAQFAIIYADILNTQFKAKDYLENATVKVVYDDVYEYAGWVYQRNYNNKTWSGASIDADKNKQNTRWVINVADQFAIDPLYMGHYIFGCTLPNAVVEGKKPLKMIVTLDGNEITYNIRK